MKRLKKRLRLLITLQSILLLVMPAAPAWAARLQPGDYQTVRDTMNDLHLSADQFEIEAGEIYQIDVLPAEYAAPLGWEFGEIDFGGQEKMLEVVRNEDLEEGTEVKRFIDGKEVPYLYGSFSEDEPQTLCFFVLGKESGSLLITASLKNPVWEETFGEKLPELAVSCMVDAVPQGTKAARKAAQEEQIRNMLNSRENADGTVDSENGWRAEAPGDEDSKAFAGNESIADDSSPWISDSGENDTAGTTENGGAGGNSKPTEPKPGEEGTNGSGGNGSTGGNSKPTEPKPGEEGTNGSGGNGSTGGNSKPTEPKPGEEGTNGSAGNGSTGGNSRPTVPKPGEEGTNGSAGNGSTGEDTSPTEPKPGEDDSDTEEKPETEGQDITKWIDQSSLKAVYNGKVHAPRLNLPAGYTASGITGGIDAGQYTDSVTVRDAAGKVIGSKQITYVIEPSVITVRHLYDAENSRIVTDVQGIVDEDIVSIKDNDKDANADGTDIGKSGRYEISTVVEIDESKTGNYIIEEGNNSVSRSDAYVVKGNNPWYEIDMDYSIDESTSQLTVNFYLENLRTEQVGQNASRLLTLEICVYFDEELLSYSGKNDQYNNWRVDFYYPEEHKKEFSPDPITGESSGVAPDLTVSYTGMCKGLAGKGVRTKICSIVYDIKDGNVQSLSNTVISADNINYDAYFDLGGSNNTDIPAKYWADPAYITINPDKDAPEEHEIIIEADPVEHNMTPHQSICGPSTLQEIKDSLHKYVDENMTETKPLTPSDILSDPADKADSANEAAAGLMSVPGNASEAAAAEPLSLSENASEAVAAEPLSAPENASEAAAAEPLSALENASEAVAAEPLSALENASEAVAAESLSAPKSTSELAASESASLPENGVELTAAEPVPLPENGVEFIAAEPVSLPENGVELIAAEPVPVPGNRVEIAVAEPTSALENGVMEGAPQISENFADNDAASRSYREYSVYAEGTSVSADENQKRENFTDNSVDSDGYSE